MQKNLNFIVLLIVFFGLSFITCLNDLLTPILKEMFALNQFAANLVSFAFFTAYFIGSLLYSLSSAFGIMFFVRLGYKGLILFGLTLSGIGCLIFIPAAIYANHLIFLIGLFSIGFGFTFLQISLNPLIIISGDIKTGASRLNLAGGFNSLAYTLAPLLGAYVFYTVLHVNTNHNNLKYPYMFLALFFLVFIFFIYKALNTDEHHTFSQETGKPLALNHANLLFGMLAIFFYVGSEVSIGTNLISYLKSPDTVALSNVTASKLLACYWGGAMIGRFLGAVALSSMMNGIKKLLVMIILAIILTWLILFTTKIGDISITYFVVFQIVAIVLFMCCRTPRINLALFCLVNIINLIFGVSMHNSWFAVWAILSTGIFNSIMWPNIFDLAIADLGKYKEQGSSFLVMMILGGALVPIIQGYLADKTDIITSFVVPAIGYVYILGYSVFYSKKGHKFNLIKAH